ncbi:MAG: PAS domain S-box protein, partial [Bacteroidota bacterium]
MVKKRILLFEENPDYERFILRSFGKYTDRFVITSCSSLEEFDLHLKKEDIPFDLILYCIATESAPVMGLIHRAGVKDRIPVVFLNGPLDDLRGIELVKRGALDFIPKNPRSIHHLPENLIRLLRDWENIVARRLAEEKLLETESKYRRVTENINDVVWEMDVRMKMFTFISESVQRFLGFTAEEFLRCSPTDIMHPESVNLIWQTRKNFISRLCRGEQPENIQFNNEIAFIHKNGHICWGEVRGFLVTGENREVVSVSGIVRNITAQKQAQQQLRIQEAFFETLIREAPIGIVILDNNDQIKQVNKHFLELFGFSEKECVGMKVNDLIVPDDLKDEGTSFTHKAALGEYIDSDTVRKKKNGEPVDVHILGKPVMLNDSQLAVFGIYQDISQRKRVEVANRVAQIKQQFLANMSHEIRSPMTGIMGMIDMLSKTSLSREQTLFVEVIKKSSDSLLNIVNDILDLSKIEAGKIIIRPKNFNLRRSAGNLFSLFSAIARQKNLEFRLDFDDNLPEVIFADENRLSQIITNLLSNAVKFTPEGSVTLKYQLLKHIDAKALVRISVIDTGIGIREKDKENLFKIFSQIDPSDTRDYEGTGLGLSISKRLAELMNAKIEVESAQGKGSTFSLTFTPEIKSGVSSDNDATENTRVTDEVSSCCRVLLTEDNKTNQMVLSLMLREIGCTVDIAANGKEALEKIVPGKYDFVFMDIQMPVMDGLTAVKELRKKYTKEQLPVIVGLSAKAMEGDPEYHIANGMDDYLTKPVTTEILQG